MIRSTTTNYRGSGTFMLSKTKDMDGYVISQFETDILGFPVVNLDNEWLDVNWDDKLPITWRETGIGLVCARTERKLREFYEVETLITLRSKPIFMHGFAEALIATPEDADKYAKMGKEFTFDRFHRDSEIPKDGADEIKSEWIRNNFNGRADVNFIYKSGFVSCVLRNGEPVIDLIAVSKKYRGLGIGRDLVNSALLHYWGTKVTVGTQADNLASLAMYKSCGFEEVDRQTTLHWTP